MKSTTESVVDSGARQGPRTLLKRYCLELILGLGIATIALYALLSNSYFVSGGLLYASVISYALCFTLTFFFIHRQNVNLVDRLAYSILSTLAGIIFFEFAWHYGFGISLAQIAKDSSFLGNNGWVTFPLDWYILILATLFVGRKYMEVNKSLIIVCLISGILMFAWIGSGYPQDFPPPWTANYFPIYQTFHVVYTNQAMIIEYSRIFNSITKIIAVIPAFFFNKKKALGVSHSR
ncbi:MAG: hypothetical protein PXY39_08855 [archaeon]|nr:hypothetical protein [archaeon]